jgi:hypothetical protein
MGTSLIWYRPVESFGDGQGHLFSSVRPSLLRCHGARDFEMNPMPKGERPLAGASQKPSVPTISRDNRCSAADRIEADQLDLRLRLIRARLVGIDAYEVELVPTDSCNRRVALLAMRNHRRNDIVGDEILKSGNDRGLSRTRVPKRRLWHRPQESGHIPSEAAGFRRIQRLQALIPRRISSRLIQPVTTPPYEQESISITAKRKSSTSSKSPWADTAARPGYRSLNQGGVMRRE